jgi:hypothetical protein
MNVRLAQEFIKIHCYRRSTYVEGAEDTIHTMCDDGAAAVAAWRCQCNVESWKRRAWPSSPRFGGSTLYSTVAAVLHASCLASIAIINCSASFSLSHCPFVSRCLSTIHHYMFDPRMSPPNGHVTVLEHKTVLCSAPFDSSV